MGRYTYTATGDLGVQRSTMLQNELHQRPAIGKPLPRGRDLPPPSYAYGQREISESSGVGPCLRWNEDLTRNKDKYLRRNYIKCNKGAIQSGAYTASEFKEFAFKAPLERLPGNSRYQRKRESMTFPDDYAFGTPCKSTTNIGDILSYRYGNEWAEQAGKRNEFLRVVHDRQPWDTVSSALANVPGRNEEYSCRKQETYSFNNKYKERWFKVTPKINTYLKESARSSPTQKENIDYEKEVNETKNVSPKSVASNKQQNVDKCSKKNIVFV